MLKKIFVTLFIVLICGAVVFASGGGEKEKSKALSTKHGGTLTIGQTADIRSPKPTDLGQPQELFYQQIFDTLIHQTKDGKVEPMLAESWEWSAEKTKIRFKLRKDVKWHSGRPFTAEDVVANIKNHHNKKTGSKLRTSLEIIQKMEAMDDHTVDFYLKSFTPDLFDTLSMTFLIDPEVMGQDNQMQGTGPFKFVEWIPQTRLVMERNPDYWDGDLPYLDKIVLSVQPDTQTMVANLESGAIDFIKMPPRNELDRLNKDPKFKGVISPIGNFFYAITFNCEHPILKNKTVRQALAYSMDRSRFVETFLYGQSDAQSVPFGKQSSAYDPKYVDHFKFNLDKAKSLLAEAGYPDGFDISIMVMTEADPASLQFSVMWKEDLKKIGVNMKINHVELSVWRDGKVNAKFPEILQDLYGRGAKEPVSMIKQSLPWKPDKNPSRFVSQKYRDMAAQAGKEPDDAKRGQIYHEILLFLLDEAFEVPIAPQTRFWAMKSEIMGVEHDLNIFEMFSKTWIEK